MHLNCYPGHYMAPYQLSAEGEERGFLHWLKGENCRGGLMAEEGVVTRNDEAFLAREQET